MKHFVKFTTAAVAASLFAVSAQATLLNFAITGDYSANFQLDSSPTPDGVYSDQEFVMTGVPGVFPGASAGLADIFLFSSDNGGGIELHDSSASTILLLTDGPQLYSGSESAPILLTGTFALTEAGGSGTYTLTVSEATAAVPEPASWAMMVGGFGAIGGAMRRRQKTSVTFQGV